MKHLVLFMVLGTRIGSADITIHVGGVDAKDTNAGTPDAPVATISHALKLAAASGTTTTVVLQPGVYDEAVALVSRVKLTGVNALSPADFTNDARTAAAYAKVAVITNTRGDRVVVANGVSAASVEAVVIIGPNVQQIGGSSYGVVADANSKLSLSGVKIIGGEGGRGGPGKKGGDATQLCADGGGGGGSREFTTNKQVCYPVGAPGARDVMCSMRPFPNCTSDPGAEGTSTGRARGGEPGKAGNSFCLDASRENATAGGAGKGGASPSHSPGGRANPAVAGTFQRKDQLQWVGDIGGLGTEGISGGGGGGGGAGGSIYSDYYSTFCSDRRVVLGEAGKPGGRGGCGGESGGGGGQGGSSFGIVADNSDVRTDHVTILQGFGGRGGDGGAGGAGMRGEDGGKAAADAHYSSAWCWIGGYWYSGSGGAGGRGGDGGAGGGGAGGNGGLSVGAARIGAATVGVVTTGHGKGGVGGNGGDPRSEHGVQPAATAELTFKSQ